MTPSNHDLWTIDELGGQVALALAVDYSGQASGRVRAIPDERTIRYYTTLGLLDRPAQMRGRKALYARRHLLQLVAIKRLQARGLTLVELQERLVGQNDAALARLAKLPADMANHAEAVRVPSPRAREGFWKAAAAPVTALSTPPTATPTSADTPMAARVMQGVALAAHVTLLLEGARQLEADEVEAIHAAAGPLLKLLEKRHLIAKETP